MRRVVRLVAVVKPVAVFMLLQAVHVPGAYTAAILRRSPFPACFVDVSSASTLRCDSIDCIPALSQRLSQNRRASPGPVSFILGALRGTGARMLRQFGGSRFGSASVRPTPPPLQAQTMTSGVLRAAASSAASATCNDDLWLEDIDSDKALDWVRMQNNNTFKTLGNPAGSPLYPKLKAIYESKDKIPYAVKRGDQYYNFWQDAENPRGLWRRTSWEEYLKPTPRWEVLLDIDKLGKDEGESWVWQGSIPLDQGPGIAATRCLVQVLCACGGA